MTSLKMPKLKKIKLPTIQQVEEMVKWGIDKYNSLSPEDKERLKELFQKAIDAVRKKDSDE